MLLASSLIPHRPPLPHIHPGKERCHQPGSTGQEGGGKASLSAQGSNASSVVLLIKNQFRFMNTKAFDVVTQQMVPQR